MLINRRNVVKDPSKSVAPCEEFFMLVVEAHVLAAAMHFFKMRSLEDTPSEEFFPTDRIQKDSLQWCRALMDALQKLTMQFVDLNITFKENCSTVPQGQADTVQEYAGEVLSLGLLVMEFNDTIHKGDRSRILHCWLYCHCLRPLTQLITPLRHSLSLHRRNIYSARGWQCN